MIQPITRDEQVMLTSPCILQKQEMHSINIKVPYSLLLHFYHIQLMAPSVKGSCMTLEQLKKTKELLDV